LRARHRGWFGIAICTVLLSTFSSLLEAAPAAEEAYRDGYRRQEIARGARKLTVLAQLEYRSAIERIESGERDEAVEHLLQAIRFDPEYAPAYFALSRTALLRLDIDAPVYLIQGVSVALGNFRKQSALAVGSVSALAYILLVLNFIVCTAFAIKYLPYLAHKLSERLERRFNASLPTTASYLLLLSPVLFFVNTIIPLAYLTVLCWLSMYRREKVLVVLLVAPFVFSGFFDIHFRLGTVLADPKSLTSLADRANDAGGDEYLIQAIEQAPAAGVESDKNLALGLLYLKAGRYYEASDRLFKAVSLEPNRTMGYVNLGNVRFMQADYEKALQGYRKAEGIDSMDPVCQYNLAQAYIKTLLMKEASRALQLAGSGIEEEKSRYAEEAFEAAVVLPRLFSTQELWNLALDEARSLDQARLAEGRNLLPWLPGRASAIIVILAVVLAVLLTRLIDPETLTFQCSNCGMLTCNACCVSARDTTLCGECAAAIESVTSEKVVDALLRQRRQAVVVHRRRSARLVSIVLPGMRDLQFGHVARGLGLAAVFSASIVLPLAGASGSGGAVSTENLSVWKLAAGAVGVLVAFILSVRSKPSYTFKPQRHKGSQTRSGEALSERPKTNRAA
jgi:tetratricopeptide (TPR) repeat protein